MHKYLNKLGVMLQGWSFGRNFNGGQQSRGRFEPRSGWNRSGERWTRCGRANAAPCERNQVIVGKADRNQQRGGSLLQLGLARPELQEGEGKEKGEQGVLMRTRPDLPRGKGTFDC